MFQQTSPLTLFATPVFAQDLPPAERAAFDRALIAGVGTLGATPTGPQPWRSSPDLQRLPAFRALSTLAGLAAERALDQLRSEQRQPLLARLTATLEPAGSALPMQQQANAYFGGLYLAAGSGQDQVRFLDPRPQAHLLTGPAIGQAPASAADATLPLRPGRLLLFPAWLWHATLPNPGPQPRLLFSLAITFQHFRDTLSPPRWSGMTAGGR